MIFSAGCAGGRCRRRARPGKEAEGRLSLRVLGYYITGISYCKVKLYDLYPVFRLFCLCWAKKYRPQPWAARWDGAGRPSGPSVVPAGTSLSPAVPTPARTPGRGATCSAQTPGIRFPVTPQWRITSSGAGKTGRTVLPSHSPAGSSGPYWAEASSEHCTTAPGLGQQEISVTAGENCAPATKSPILPGIPGGIGLLLFQVILAAPWRERQSRNPRSRRPASRW